MTQESFRENSLKELGRLEGQLAALREELAALSLKQSSVAERVGLLPQELQALRDDVSQNRPSPPRTPCPQRVSVLGVCTAKSLLPRWPAGPLSPWTWPRCWLSWTVLPVLLPIT